VRRGASLAWNTGAKWCVVVLCVRCCCSVRAGDGLPALPASLVQGVWRHGRCRHVGHAVLPRCCLVARRRVELTGDAAVLLCTRFTWNLPPSGTRGTLSPSATLLGLFSSLLPPFSPHLLVPLSDAGTCAESGYKMREFEEWWEACGAMQEGGRERDEEAERGEEAGRHEVAADRRRGARNGRYGRVQDARARPEFYGFSSPLPPAALQASRIVTQALAPSSAPARTSGLVRVPPLL